MIKAGVLRIPGSVGLLDSVEQGENCQQNQIPRHYWYMAGGGGRGMRIIHLTTTPEGWDARRESKAAFGNDGMYQRSLWWSPPPH
jgi:pyruvate carboxylase